MAMYVSAIAATMRHRRVTKEKKRIEKCLQMLKDLGYYDGRIIDYENEDTRKAVRACLKDIGWKEWGASGRIDNGTQYALEREMEKRKWLNT